MIDDDHPEGRVMHRNILAVAGLSLLAAGAAHAQAGCESDLCLIEARGIVPIDCYNDDILPASDEQPAALRVTEGDVERMLAAIAAHERHLRAEREKRERAQATAPATGSGG